MWMPPCPVAPKVWPHPANLTAKAQHRVLRVLRQGIHADGATLIARQAPDLCRGQGISVDSRDCDAQAPGLRLKGWGGGTWVGAHHPVGGDRQDMRAQP